LGSRAGAAARYDKPVIDCALRVRDAPRAPDTLRAVNLPHFQVHLDDRAIPWRPTSHPGVAWHSLRARELDSAADADAVVLIRMAPGRGYPAHRHLGPEDVLVLQGGYRDDLGEHRAGTYLRYPAASSHAPVACGDPTLPESEHNPACILFAIARGGVENL
jgi:anti-sigma factor ChrR (cupin superfamily)